MDELRDGQIELKVHGLPFVNGSEVPAVLFAQKLTALVKALEAADVEKNGTAVHQYTIAKLHTSSPTAILTERPKPKLFVDPSRSAIPAFSQGIDAIKAGARGTIGTVRFASAVLRMAKGSEKVFGFSEVRTGQDNVVRVDRFLGERATALARAKQVEGIPEGGWYRGVVFGTFDGKLEFVDIRGSLPQIKLTLSAGGKQIDCICRHDHIETISAALDHRVRITGRAFYDGKSGLPRRVEVTAIEQISPPKDFSVWRGSFHPFELQDWEGGNA